MITIFKPLAYLSLVLPPTFALYAPLDPSQQALLALESPALFELRAAGAFSPAAPASMDELDELARAEALAQDLESLRGGEISNRDLTTILLVLGIVVLVLILV